MCSDIGVQLGRKYLPHPEHSTTRSPFHGFRLRQTTSTDICFNTPFLNAEVTVTMLKGVTFLSWRQETKCDHSWAASNVTPATCSPHARRPPSIKAQTYVPQSVPLHCHCAFVKRTVIVDSCDGGTIMQRLSIVSAFLMQYCSIGAAYCRNWFTCANEGVWKPPMLWCTAFIRHWNSSTSKSVNFAPAIMLTDWLQRQISRTKKSLYIAPDCSRMPPVFLWLVLADALFAGVVWLSRSTSKHLGCFLPVFLPRPVRLHRVSAAEFTERLTALWDIPSISFTAVLW